jgi:uncharacterized membrane protein
MMGFGLVWMVLILAGTVAVALWLAKLLFPDRNRSSATNSHQESGEAEAPFAAARRRYAAGEIAKEEFEQLKRDLA